MEERTVADYFVIAGLPEIPERVDEETYCEGLNPNLKNIEPITDITIIFPSLGEEVPKGFSCVEKTPSGYPANLNSGSIRSPEVYLCYRRGRDKPPLVDIGVMYDGKERLLPDAEVVISTPEGRPANVNNTAARILLTYRRAGESMPCNELVVTDVCVIITNKGERPPHAFCQIAKNLNKGTIMGCDVYLCYKKSMNRPPLITYKADVLLRYPPIDRRGFPFPSSVGMFCLPMCATVESWPSNASQPRPVFSTFVLTVADATEKIYGAAVTFYEKYDDEKLSEEQRGELGISVPGSGRSIHVNKSICILSHYSFFDTFRTYLLYLTKMALMDSNEVPIERYISHLLTEVPFPSPQRPHILLQLSATQCVLMSHPHDSPLPKSGASFRLLLSNLGPENCLLILVLILTEQKLLIHSLRPDVLTAVAEAVSVLIFPFHWQCPYIPLCPLGLCAVLQAPVPFLIGVDSRFFDLFEPPADVTCVDLDTMSVTVSEDKRQHLTTKLLPKKAARILKNTLEGLQDKVFQLSRTKQSRRGDLMEMDVEFKIKKKERTLETEIQESFLRFMTGILRGYRKFLLPITKAPTIGATDATALFDFQGFQRSRDKSYQKFYQLMLRTQMFIRFIEERSFVSDIDTGLAFFDECLDKVEADDSESVRLVDLQEGNQSERTLFVMPPEPAGLPPNKLYEYKSLFVLSEGLFGGTPKYKASCLDRVIGQGSEFGTPGSPVARRTKQEIKSAKRNARKYSEQPVQWAKYLMSTCHTLWFIHLPSYVTVVSSKNNSQGATASKSLHPSLTMEICSASDALSLAYEMLVRMTKNQLQPKDEVCYRVVMQLCGLYNQPVIAVKVLFEMKRCGLSPNALTYGYYNKAVLEAEWPSNVSNSSQLMWNKLRNVIAGVAQFRAAGRRNRRLSLSTTTDEADRLSTGSGGSVESQAVKVIGASTTTTNLLSPTSATTERSSVSVSSARASASSDIGYVSMPEQEQGGGKAAPDEPDDGKPPPEEGLNKFWGKMGQSFDSWVKSSVSTLATNVGTLGAAFTDPNYYSPAGLIMSSYRGDYSSPKFDLEDEEEDLEEEPLPPLRPSKSQVHRRLDFSSPTNGPVPENENTMRLLRSVSFGNDTEIMSKLKELKKEETRGQSVESNGSLETKVNQFYEELETTQESREITPVDEDPVPPVNGPRSPSLPIFTTKSRDNSCPGNLNEFISRDGSSVSSPARTPVTQNDPLGALGTGQMNKLQVERRVTQKESPKRTSSEGNIGFCQIPMSTGEGRGHGQGHPSHNHHGMDLSGVTIKGFHRSSTLPNYATSLENPTDSGNSTPARRHKLIPSAPDGGNNVVSSFSAFGTSLKSFSRYSPARLSLRKAGTQLLESTIGNKKAEAFMEGFNQLKSVATVTAKKKLDEIKGAMNNNSPANKNGPFARTEESGYTESGDIVDGTENGSEPSVDQWASVSESYLDQLLTSDQVSARGSFASAEGLGPSQQETPLSSSRQSLLTVENMAKTLNIGYGRKGGPHYPVALEIHMTSCSVCHNCEFLLFDEDIMAGWTTEDSNLNTRCPHCRKWEVPFLEVVVKDFRHVPLSHTRHPNLFGLHLASSNESMVNSSKNPNIGRRSSFNPSVLTQNVARIDMPVTSGRKLSLNPSVPGSLDPSHSPNNATNILKSNNGEPTVEMDPLGVLGEKAEVSTETDTPQLILTTQDDEKVSDKVPWEGVDVEGLESEVIIVPYLSPLVLRKELENVLEHEGDSCLIQSLFVDEHPIIYWNMVWFFHRSNLKSHLKGLALHSTSTKPKEEFVMDSSWEQADQRNVVIRAKWDNPKFHAQFGLPLYVHWLQIRSQQGASEGGKEELKKSSPSYSPGTNDIERLINEIVRTVSRGGDMSLMCSKLLYHYHKSGRPRHYPAYRDILFLALLACEKDTVDLYGFGFDKDYRNSYSRLRNSDEYETMDSGDSPPGDSALFARKFFRDLELV